MKFSKMLTKMLKSSKTFDSINATYLTRGGFIDQTMSGVYSYLPLGWRVLHKIENIVREEMDTIAEEVFLPSMVPFDIWQTTGRIDSVDVLMKAVPANAMSKERNDAEYILNCTHEDTITPIAKKFATSYRELPKAVYQIQTKFRNEARAKAGILRGREFRMKDLYSFHASVEDFKRYYEKSKEVYMSAFKRLGLGKDTVIAAASGGDFTDDYSHEFQTKCEAGEDTLFYVSSTQETFNKEIAPAKAVKLSKDTKQKPLEKVFGEGIIGVDDLCKFMGITPEETTKTLIFETENGPIICSIRGDYDVNELKLKKVAGVKSLKLASEKVVKKVTGSIIGYAGVYNLPKGIPVYIDDSSADLVNFETGANEAHYHMKNMNWDRDVKRPAKFYDIKVAKVGDIYPETGEVYDTFRAAEVGNIFPLYTRFSDAVGYKYTDDKGNLQPVYMGSYGLGTTRVMGVLVEKFHDDKGIIWPIQVAPYIVHLVTLGESTEVMELATRVYDNLLKNKVEIVWDDRTSVSAGEKFTDADLIGCPIRLTISARSLEKNGVEIKARSRAESKIISEVEVLKSVETLADELLNE